MPTRLTILACLVLPAVMAAAGGGQDQKPKPALIKVQGNGSGGSLSIAFLQIGAPIAQSGTGQATLDLGQLTYFGCTSQPGVSCRTLPGAFRVSTDFGIRVDSQGNAAKTATVSAFVLAGTSFPVAVDAVLLQSAEQVITANASYGVVVAHTLSIDVSTTLPAGPLTVTLGIMAAPN